MSTYAQPSLFDLEPQDDGLLHVLMPNMAIGCGLRITLDCGFHFTTSRADATCPECLEVAADLWPKFFPKQATR